MAFQLKKVLISDEVDPKCVDILKSNGIEVVKDTSLAKNKEQLLTEIQKYDGLIVRSATTVSADVINAGTNLKIIGRAGTGVDNIDCDAATKRGVIVMNTPGGNTMSAVEHTCALLLAMTRHVSQGTESLRAGRWDRKKYMGNEVLGKTLGIIGLGRIGKEVALRMQAFGMTTIGFDPIIPAEETAKFGVESMSLEDLWPKVDYVTVHTPLIPQTKNLINETVFGKCKKGVKVINCARGGIIDEDALLKALESGQCGAAGLDVFMQEPPTNTALIQHPRVTCTPHLGASTIEAQSRVAEEIAQQFVDAVNGKSLFGALNAQAMQNALTPDTKPWTQLGGALGKLAAQMAGDANEVALSIQGSSLSKAGSYLSAAVLTGLLASKAQNGLNLVSAPALAKELGVAVKTSHKEGGCCNTVTLTVGTTSLCGTVAVGSPALCAVNGQVFSQPTGMLGNMLLYKGGDHMAVLTALTAAAGAPPQSFTMSSVDGGESWVACNLAAPLANTDSVKGITSAAYSVSF